jgi:hypothetical protein
MYIRVLTVHYKFELVLAIEIQIQVRYILSYSHIAVSLNNLLGKTTNKLDYKAPCWCIYACLPSHAVQAAGEVAIRISA